VVRHAGRAVEDRSQSALESTSASRGVALLEGPAGSGADDPRLTSGARLTPAFGIQVGRRASAHHVPAFGSPEHSALLTGSLDLDAIESAAQQPTGPLVGFAPIVLDPRGPSAEDEFSAPAASATPVLPSRRSLREASGRGRQAAEAPGTGLPQPRSGAARRRGTLAASDDPTPTGELARPFVTGTAPSDWDGLETVPPPVSVDVFQRAVRAGLALDDREGLKALDESSDVAQVGARGGRRPRREQRAREKAVTSTRGVAARRIAKGGVLAITALGVVSAATPQGLDAFGLSKDDTASRNTVDFAKALAPDVSAPVLTTAQINEVRRSALQGHLQSELTDQQASNVARAGARAGGTLAQLALDRDAEVAAQREAARQAAIRDAQRDPQAYARFRVTEMGWGDGQFQCLVSLWNRESQWNYRATNSSSGAYGIAQALPGSKMNVVGPDWRTNPVTQIKWGLNYIADRYGTPCGAWSHSQATGWY